MLEWIVVVAVVALAALVAAALYATVRVVDALRETVGLHAQAIRAAGVRADAMISELCQRIQAPELAVARHDADAAGAGLVQPPMMDDDQAYWEQVEAERQAAREAGEGSD